MVDVFTFSAEGSCARGAFLVGHVLVVGQVFPGGQAFGFEPFFEHLGVTSVVAGMRGVLTFSGAPFEQEPHPANTGESVKPKVRNRVIVVMIIFIIVL